ncbi:hypothetical protein J7643_17135 [bacterium]|nr:hypothetical protein [bacterium]
MKHGLCSLALGAALLAGCAGLATTATSGNASLAVRPLVENGQYRTQDMGGNTLNPYKATDIAHLVVKVYTVSGGTETPWRDAASNPVVRDVASSSLEAPISFDKLRPHTTYRLKAYAYKALGTDASDLISVEGGSTVDLVVTNDDRPAVGSLPVKLKSVAFGAETNENWVDVVNGGTATRSETIE